ncbi:hypothetical protein M2266_000656 [Streptomyces sp. SPB162]|nr:hypothetical protein [Streptomyces sp. SPB162]
MLLIVAVARVAVMGDDRFAHGVVRGNRVEADRNP